MEQIVRAASLGSISFLRLGWMTCVL